jgi:hypothetical protein
MKKLKLSKEEIEILETIKTLKTEFDEKGLKEEDYDEMEDACEALKEISCFDVRC